MGRINGDKVTYFDSFIVEYIPKEIKRFKGNINIITNAYRIQLYNSKMHIYFRIGFIDFMLKNKSIFNYTNLFSPKKYESNYKVILKYFQ